MWTTTAKYCNADDKLRKLTKKLNEDRKTKLVTEIQEAQKDGDARKFWHMARIMGGKHVGTRKRQWRQPTTTDPTLDEWLTAMAKKGGEGGCKAKEIKRGHGAYPPGERSCDTRDGFRHAHGHGR